ncbi:hypothetical protein Leryth_026350 [Lithospermum erythrorhizon]|nr:hypothetical protein Leryth_026350 [Lithospermum erythrorhizon]
MGSSSIANLSSCFSPSKFSQNSKLANFCKLNPTKSLQNPQIFQYNLNFSNTNHNLLHKTQPSKLLWKNPSFSPPQKPISQSSFSSFSVLQKMISQFFLEKIVFYFLGSFILMGSVRARPVIAQTTQESVNIVEEEEMYVKLLDENPLNIEALKMIVNVKMRNGKTGEAVKYVEKLIEMQPDEVEWRLLEALCYEMIGQFSKARTLFKDILNKRPLLLRALHGLAMVMHKNLEGPAVFEMLNSALELAHREKRVSEERNIRILIAQMHTVKGELIEALGKFEILINENPRDFRPYLCQGIIYSLVDKKKEAEERFEIYRSLVPEEFPQRGFLDDVVFAAKTDSRQQLGKELKS